MHAIGLIDMLKTTWYVDSQTGEEWIETPLHGKQLLLTSLLNKGTAFSMQERQALKLLGKLPYKVETLEEQLARVKKQFNQYTSHLQKYIYLNNLHDKNEILFYKLLLDNLAEMLPLIYTPGVGLAVKQFSHQFRQPRGLYIAYPDRDKISMILDNRTHAEIDLIVVTDGERILGIGDQGIGGMDIPIAKLIVYCLCGVAPYKTLPIMLDVGTDNPQLLDDPFYLGWRHPRIKGKEYDEFIYLFMQAIHQQFPQSFLHWEDFAQQNARRILETYSHQHCTFNDDMQGTGVVTLAALLSAMTLTQSSWAQQRIVIFGAGIAGVGIADQLCALMVRQGIEPLVARRQFWLVDRQGLLFEGMTSTPFQQPYLRPVTELKDWQPYADLEAIIKHVKPTILLGCSTVAGAFTENIVRRMSTQLEQPIIFPLSNPTEHCEATPDNLIKWSNGKALIATGSPFKPVKFAGKTFHIAQCNNALSFPGIGIGTMTVKAKEVTDNMLWAATQAIFEQSLPFHAIGALLPPVTQLAQVAIKVALAVARQALLDGVASKPDQSLAELIEQSIWRPHYHSIKPSRSL